MTAEEIYRRHEDERKRRLRERLPGFWLVLIAIPFVAAALFTQWQSNIPYLFALVGFFFVLPISIPYVLFAVALIKATRELGKRMDPNSVLTGHMLFLRPFVSDSISAKRNVFPDAFLTQYSYISKCLLPETNLQRLIGPEVTKRIGPFVAISNPKEWMRSGGAVKLEAADEEWQTIVSELARTARGVILEIGATSNFLWELRFVRENVALEKVFAVIGFEDVLEKSWPNVRDAFLGVGYELPMAYPGNGTVIAFDGQGGGNAIRSAAETVEDLISPIQARLVESAGPSNEMSSDNVKPSKPATIAPTGVPAGQSITPDEPEAVERRKWEKRLMRGVFSGGAAGCLLVVFSILGLLLGCYLTYLCLQASGVVVTSAGRGAALILALPSIGLGVATFYIFSPFLFRFHKRSAKNSQTNQHPPSEPEEKT